jgi:hypothetical protein
MKPRFQALYAWRVSCIPTGQVSRTDAAAWDLAPCYSFSQIFFRSGQLFEQLSAVTGCAE